jgi:hypothetical protein
MHAVNPYATCGVELASRIHRFANNGIRLGHFPIFSNAPTGNLPHGRGKEPVPKWYTDCVIAFANGLNSSVDSESDEAGKREPLCN